MQSGKHCKKCLKWQPINYFSKSPRHNDGLQSKCRPCRSDEYREYRKRVPRNKEKQRNYEREYRRSLSPEQYATLKEYRAAYYQRNKERLDAQRKDYLARNPGLNSFYVKRYREKRKAKRFKILAKDYVRLKRQHCFYCGQDATTVDHLIPISKGGNHSIGNLVAACLSCNSSKHVKFLFEWKIQRRKQGKHLIFDMERGDNATD